MFNTDKFVFWIESGEKKWDMCRGDDWQILCLNLLNSPFVDNHSIFIIPSSAIMNGIWVQKDTHKSGNVNFSNFYKDLGEPYVPPKAKPEDEDTIKEMHERHSNDTKYGWISPEGRYFHCGYQCHAALADRICFGMADTNNAEHYLEEHGWCKIYKPLFEEKYSVYVGGSYVINDSQMKTLIELGLENANHLSEMLCKE